MQGNHYGAIRIWQTITCDCLVSTIFCILKQREIAEWWPLLITKFAVSFSESICHAFRITIIFSWAFICKGRRFLRPFISEVDKLSPLPPGRLAADPTVTKTTSPAPGVPRSAYNRTRCLLTETKCLIRLPLFHLKKPVIYTNKAGWCFPPRVLGL